MIHEAPDLFALMTERQRGNETVWEHSLAVMDRVGTDPILVFTGLLHDTGKVRAAQDNDRTGTSRHPYTGHEIISALIATRFLGSMGQPVDLTQRVERMVRWHMMDVSQMASRKGARNLISKVGPRDALKWFIFRRAESQAYGGSVHPRLDKLEEYVREQLSQGSSQLTLTDLAITSGDVMRATGGIEASKANHIMGDILAAVQNGTHPNKREVLIRVAIAAGGRR